MNLTAAEERVLVLMPSARDGERTVHLLGDADLPSLVCPSLSVLCAEIAVGAGAIVLTDEILAADIDHQLDGALRKEPPWSALPILVLARGTVSESMQASVVIVERPVRTRSLVSAVQSALRARRTQYQMRDAIRERERADRLKDEFLATLAHELRNPLAPITAGLALIGRSNDEALTARTVAVMERQVKHMVRLIDDLMDVSRITRGMLALKRERFAIRAAIQSAIESNQPTIERRQHTLHVDLPDEELCLDADQTRISQVVSNLLNNACKYTPSGGKIDLAVARDNDHVVITVRDNGLGMPPNSFEEIFRMFGQVNRALDRSQGGLGIGLALVRRLVEMHGGSIDAFSAGPDKGSTFSVRLPLVVERASSEAPPPSLHFVPPPEESRILVVDDNEDAAELLALTLEQAGYETTTARDGTEALETARRVIPSLIILDIGLPGMTGYEVAEELRRDPNLSQTALVALTGWGTPEDRKKAMDAGFDVHLTKPVAGDDLHRAIGSAFRRRRRANGA